MATMNIRNAAMMAFHDYFQVRSAHIECQGMLHKWLGLEE